MKIYSINPETNFDLICERIKPQNGGREIMRKKIKSNFFYIKDIKPAAANILKQDALSIGAELVCNEKVILNDGIQEALLIANDKQCEILAKKELAQDFGLKDVAKFLKLKFLPSQQHQIMGVLNINDDSFNPHSRININDGISKIEEMIEQGADIIDIGGVSSRPGSEYCGRDEEFRRIKDLISEIGRLNLFKKVKFSLDSFDEYCLEFALNNGFSIINDINGDISLCKLAAKYNATYVLMHMQGNPQNMQISPQYDDLLFEMDEFFKAKLESIKELNFNDIVLDVGIGFGKTAEQNLILIKHLRHFTHFGLPLLVGASRKSVIDYYSKSDVSQRLAGSLYLHQKSLENGASIIRTHDVFAHKQLLDMMKAMDKIVL